MDDQVAIADRIPTVTLNRRLDGFGAVFDEAAPRIASEAPFWILVSPGLGEPSRRVLGTALSGSLCR